MRDFQIPGRSPAMARHAMAATSHPLATAAALSVLERGGNAVDAAITAVAVLSVVEPHMTGIGGDCFALIAPKGRGDIQAFDGSGRAPMAATPEKLASLGITEMTRTSPHAVTIPGAVDAWIQMLADHGTWGLADVLAPAIAYARDGYPITPRVAHDWAQNVDILKENPAARETFLPGDKAPDVGDIHRQPKLAATLETIAAKGRAGFYEGAVAEDMVACLQERGGLHTLDDFKSAQGNYVTPISTDYRGYTIFECPPAGQGVAALEILNIMEGYDVSALAPLSPDRLHLQVEAQRIAYRDRDQWIADPTHTDVPTQDLLSKSYAKDVRATIDAGRAMTTLPAIDFPDHRDTVYLCVVDKDRTAISLINSLFWSFGSGIMASKSGVMLQNRGMGFLLDPAHPRAIAPGKRPSHTIIPGMVIKDGRAVMPFGVMGGQYQAMGHAHVLCNIFDYGMDVQAAIDFPRVFHDGTQLTVEDTVPDQTLRELNKRGHDITPSGSPIGGGQAIWIDHERSTLSGGSDPRKDGCALGF